jgi:hypothetical protein
VVCILDGFARRDYVLQGQVVVDQQRAASRQVVGVVEYGIRERIAGWVEDRAAYAVSGTVKHGVSPFAVQGGTPD